VFFDLQVHAAMESAAPILLNPPSTMEVFPLTEWRICDAEAFIPIVSPRGVILKSLFIKNDKSSGLKSFLSWLPPPSQAIDCFHGLFITPESCIYTQAQFYTEGGVHKYRIVHRG